jgi:hypothetical protein
LTPGSPGDPAHPEMKTTASAVRSFVDMSISSRRPANVLAYQFGARIVNTREPYSPYHDRATKKV